MEQLKGASLREDAGSFANIRLGRRGLPDKNTLAYGEKSQLTGVKSFITLAPEIL